MNFPDEIFFRMLAPLLSAQVFFSVLIYLILVRKQFVSEYKIYISFISVFILLLITFPIQSYIDSPWMLIMHDIRHSTVVSIAMPLLLLAVLRQSGYQISWRQFGGVIAVGSIFSGLFWFSGQLNRGNFPEIATVLGGPETELFRFLSHGFRAAGAVVILVIPCSLFLWRELYATQKHRNLSLIFTISGAWSFGFFFFIANLSSFFVEGGWFLIYVGYICCAICIALTVYWNIREMQGDVARMKDQLEALIQTGSRSIGEEVDRLLTDIEKHSKGDLEIYKIRVHDVLNRITNHLVDAGGDWSLLVERTKQSSEALEDSSDAAAVRHIARSEVEKLSEIRSEIPDKKKKDSIAEAKTFIQKNFDRDISVEEIAEKVGFSRAYFMREFKKQTDQTANQFLTQVRIDNAKELLAKHSVTDTAFLVGYNNSNYFTKVFKKSVGQTPSQFKEE